MTAAIARSRNEKRITPAHASSLLHRFRQHLTGRYLLIEIAPALISHAMNLANTHGLRAYDAVQLATALVTNRFWTDAGHPPVTLVSSDKPLNGAANAEGLSVEDSGDHP